MKFIIDTQLPPVLASFLNRIGHDAVHTSYYPDGQFLNDIEIAEISKNEHRIIVTKDSDFFDKYFVSDKSLLVLYLKVGNIKNDDLIDLLQIHLNLIIEEFEKGAGMLILTRDQLIAY